MNTKKDTTRPESDASSAVTLYEALTSMSFVLSSEGVALSGGGSVLGEDSRQGMTQILQRAGWVTNAVGDWVHPDEIEVTEEEEDPA